MQEALALVRAELGSQAAVLRTREVRVRGLSRLWNGGTMVEVVASDNVSVPGRFTDPFGRASMFSAPQAPAGLDLTELDAANESRASASEAAPRVANYLARGVRPLAAPDVVEDLVALRPTGAPLVVVHGGIRGAGATTVSWRLAQALARHGLRAIWVNADLTHDAPQAPLSEYEGALSDVLAGRRTVHEVLTRGPEGIQCIRHAVSGHQATFTERDQARCWRQLASLSPHAEVVVLDVGSEPHALHAPLWQAAHAVCVVVTPADEAILRGYAAIKKHRAQLGGSEVLSFVNRAGAAEAACVSGRIATACRRFLDLKATFAGHLGAEHGSVELTTRNESSPAGQLDLAAELLWTTIVRAEQDCATDATGFQNL